MSISFSKYVRQGKKTFCFIRMSGGSYGCNKEYKYGYFNGDRFDGIHYSNDKHTEYLDDPDEKDGIGGMIPVRKRSLWIGSFLDGKKDGFCVELIRDDDYCSDSNLFYEMDTPMTVEELKERCEMLELDNGEAAYCYKNYVLIYNSSNRLIYLGQAYSEDEPYFCKVFDDNDGEVTACGYYIGNTHIPFVFEDWEKMPVDPIDEDGFSVLREMDYFSDGDLRYTITEGLFKDGELNGFGTVYYNSNVNGYHNYYQRSGLFKDDVLIWGYRNQFENTGGRGVPTYFGYMDEPPVEEYGAEILYDGKRYIGEHTDGIPNGIGCMFESDEKMLKGTFRNGRLHGIGATYKLIDDKWIPYDYLNEKKDDSYYWSSWGIFVDGEFKPGMSWEEFYENEQVKKV